MCFALEIFNLGLLQHVLFPDSAGAVTRVVQAGTAPMVPHDASHVQFPVRIDLLRAVKLHVVKRPRYNSYHVLAGLYDHSPSTARIPICGGLSTTTLCRH